MKEKVRTLVVILVAFALSAWFSLWIASETLSLVRKMIVVEFLHQHEQQEGCAK